jgi:hypothetical protein
MLDSVVTTGSTETAADDCLLDCYEAPLAPGSVIGSAAGGRGERKGIDTERVISIDHGALRIAPLLKPAWGRSGISYGPFSRRNGLAFGTLCLNGHNISRTSPLPDRFKGRLWRWAIGSETERPLKRIIHWARKRQRTLLYRRLFQWARFGTRFFQVPIQDENLSVGWFPAEIVIDPLRVGSALTVHAVIPEGGELWATGSSSLSAFQGLQNIPMYYFVALRDHGAAFYAASAIAGVPGLETYPYMRLLAIEPFADDKTVYAGIHQCVLGEIGFRVDTRVYRSQVDVVPEFSNWYGSAHGADSFRGEGLLHLSSAETGARWDVCEGRLSRTSQGLIGMDLLNSALLELDSPAGIIHVLIEVGKEPVDGVGIIFRAKDPGNFWYLELGAHFCRIGLRESGHCHNFASDDRARLVPNAVNSLQIADDGKQFRIHLNGTMIYNTAFSDTRWEEATAAGVRLVGRNEGVFLRDFEAHPRRIPVPPAFKFDSPFSNEHGRTAVVQDDFSGPAGHLAGRTTLVGGQTWRKEMGAGSFELTGAKSVKVVATPQTPCPNRTAYTVSWINPHFADVQINICPPGTNKGQNERGRGGLILWEDARNYIIFNLWNDDACWSVSSFFCVEGYEEIYDAVWTNIGRRVRWGIPYDFRVIFRRNSFLCHLNDEPVLYRALTDIYPDWNNFLINRVGIVANWEWGTDTGSVFQNFLAKDS